MANRLAITPGSNQCIVAIGDHSFFFSYTTCVAYCNADMQIKRAEKISKTTSRHLTEMGCDNFTPLSEPLFLAGVQEACKILGFNLTI